jgi:hypothetical protein
VQREPVETLRGGVRIERATGVGTFATIIGFSMITGFSTSTCFSTTITGGGSAAV